MENLYIHKTKALEATPVKQKRGRPPKPKSEIPISKSRTPTAAKTPTIRPRQHPRSLNNEIEHPRSLNNEIVSRQMIAEINMEREKSRQVNSCKIKRCQTV